MTAAAGSSDLKERFRKADLQLRVLLLGDGVDTPGLVRGEERRQRVSTTLRHLRDAFAAAVEFEAARAERAEAREAKLEEELRRITVSPRARHGAADVIPALLTPIESAEYLGVSVASIYRAVRTGELRAIQPTDRKRGAIRIPTSDLDRLLDQAGAGRPPLSDAV
jgi:excisionase family DNA binding protein